MSTNEATLAAPYCYGCEGTGKIQGFGCHGATCPCVAHCHDCCEPFAWEHDDECAPKLCPRCAAETADTIPAPAAPASAS